ncbi:MAG: lytic murein transglycosylase [Sphingomonadaceae bacterium]|nr:lytic murein transglycosylase [Sphingomonadaceae bacterium]
MRALLPIALTALSSGPGPEPSAAPAAQPARAASAAAIPAPPTPAPESAQADFTDYLGQVRAKALAQGVSATTLDRELGALTPNPRVIELDRAQPDDSARVRPSFRSYLASHVDEARVRRGQSLAATHAAQLSVIEARYGVPAPLLLALWGIETSYGANTGSFDLVRSLATLAWEGRRRALFERELIVSLKLIDQGQVTRARLVGSWAGATGQPQFLPSSIPRYAVDGDGDGRADLWASGPDTLASIANYLRDNGWTAGGDWGVPAYVPPTVERWRLRSISPPRSCARPLAAHSRWISVGDWRALGVVPLGKPFPSDDTMATLIEPDGEGNGAYLTYGGYRAILAYNCANFYALSAGLLADRIAGPDRAAGVVAGGGGVQQPGTVAAAAQR